VIVTATRNSSAVCGVSKSCSFLALAQIFSFSVELSCKSVQSACL